MKDLILPIALMIATLIGLIFFLKWLYKSTMLFTFGVIWMVSTCILVIIFYCVGLLGTQMDFIWAFPIGITLVVSGMIYLKKQYMQPLTETSEVLEQLSKGHLNTRIDASYRTRKDEIGALNTSLNEFLVKLNEVLNGVKEGSEIVLSASHQLRFV